MRLFTRQPHDQPKKNNFFLICTILAVILPISSIFWIVSATFFDFNEGTSSSPFRWLLSIIFPILVAGYGLKKKSVDYSGTVSGLFVGFVLMYSSYFFFVCLLVFFLTSSKATKFRRHLKRKIDCDYKEGGQRNWAQVFCNGLMATSLALVYIIDCGCGERFIDFHKDYRAAWLAMGVVGSLACCNGDTWASELGSVIGNSLPYLITTWKPVPKGTNGGVSPGGLFFSAAGGFVIGLAYYCCLLFALSQERLENISPQWPVIIVGTFAGLFGSLLDSLLGATLQYSGLEKKSGRIVSNPGPTVNHVAGLTILDNHAVNLIASVVTGLVAPHFAVQVWEFL